MVIGLSAESTIDLTSELIKQWDIEIVPFHVTLDETTLKDGEVTPPEIFEFVKKTKKLPKTNAINIAEYTEYFKELRKKYDKVIHLSLSSKISSACSNAITASKEVDGVEVIDTLSLSTGIALLAIHIRNCIDGGMEYDQIIQSTNDRIPHVKASFVIEKLNYLYKGGRCNSLQLLGANILNLKPQIQVKDGEMIAGKKYTGNISMALRKYANDILSEYNNADKTNVFITYSTSKDSNIEYLTNLLKEAGFINIYVTSAGATISSYCGENTLGILFINDGNEHSISNFNK